MRIIASRKDYKPSGCKSLVLAVGNFDGLHLGHQLLLQNTLREAERIRGNAGVLTFREHPQRVLHPKSGPRLITSQEQKIVLLHEFGIPLCFLLPFEKDLSSMEPRVFIRKILVDWLHVDEVCLGSDARFGKDRKGDAALMRECASQLGFRFREVEAVKIRDSVVSSTRIRKLVDEGNLGEAADCLGRPFSVFGKVVHGAGRGQGLGYPTANLQVTGEVFPPYGVYPVKVRTVKLNPGNESFSSSGVQEVKKVQYGSWKEGVLNYGFRPTFHEKLKNPVAEVFVMNFRGDIVGETFEVVFYPRLREERTFNNQEDLKEQIHRDLEAAKRAFRLSPKNTFTKTVK